MSTEDDRMSQELRELRGRIDALEAKIPRSNVISPKFWSRAWAILGHQMAIVGVFYGILIALALIVGLIGILGSVAGN